MSERPEIPRSPAAGLDAQVRAVATAFLRLRPAIVIPFLALTVGALAATRAPLRQVGALGVASTLFSAFFLWERRVGRESVFGERALFRSLVATALGIALGATVTGGLASPLLPMLSAPIGVGFAAFGRTRRAAALFGLVVALSLALSALSPVVRDLVVAEGPRRAIGAMALVDSALLLFVGVASLSEAHRRAAESLARAGDEIARGATLRTRSLEELGAKVAHELKNPLTALRAIVEVMVEGGAGDARTEKRLSVLASEIARMEQIVESYASMTSPLERVRRAPVDVADLAQGLVSVLEARAARAGVALSISAPPALVFDVDRDRLREGLLNLLLNAVQATPAGGEVTLSCAEVDEGGLELSVADTGHGMDPETLARLGTPFFTLREGGTGLGVSLAQKTAALHGGALTYESAPGAGTVAKMRIPRSEGATTRPGL